MILYVPYFLTDEDGESAMERNENFLVKLVCPLQCNTVIVSVPIVIATVLREMIFL